LLGLINVVVFVRDELDKAAAAEQTKRHEATLQADLQKQRETQGHEKAMLEQKMAREKELIDLRIQKEIGAEKQKARERLLGEEAVTKEINERQNLDKKHTEEKARVKAIAEVEKVGMIIGCLCFCSTVWNRRRSFFLFVTS
jgi:vacuolar-type H+-ATPase subunit I/STV1